MKLIKTLLLFTSIFVATSHAATISGKLQLGAQQVEFSSIDLVQNGTVVTDTDVQDNSEFLFESVAAGVYTIRVRYDGSFVSSSEITIDSADESIIRNIWFIPGDAIEVAEVHTVTGDVSDFSENVYPGATIVFLNSYGEYTAIADDSGRYSLNLPSDSYQTYIRFDGTLEQFPNTRISYTSDTNYQYIDITADREFDIKMPFKEVDVDATINDEEVASSVNISQQAYSYNSVTGQSVSGYVSISHADSTTNTIMPIFENLSVLLNPLNIGEDGPFPAVITLPQLAANSVIENVSSPLNVIGAILEVGSITNLDGVELSGVCVRASSFNVPVIDISSCHSSDGNIYLPAGNYDFRVTALNPEWSPQTSESVVYFSFSTGVNIGLTPVNGKTVRVKRDFVLPVTELDIQVNDVNGGPIEDVKVSVIQSSGYIQLPNNKNGSANVIGVNGFTDNQGEVSLNVSPAIGKLLIEPAENSDFLSQVIEIKSIDTADKLNVILYKTSEEEPNPEEGFVVFGRLENLAGEPISGTVTTRDSQYNAIEDVVTDGNYSLLLTESGTYGVSVNIDQWSADIDANSNSNSYASANLDVDLFGPVRRNIIIPFLSVDGKVINSQGKPIQGLEFNSNSSIYTNSESYNSYQLSISDDQGSFSTIFLPNNINVNFSSKTFKLNQYFSFYIDKMEQNSSLDIILLTDAALTPTDSDGDGISDFYEGKYGNLEPTGDEDGDTLNNLQESRLGTHPFLKDSDLDGINDASDTYPLLPAFASAIDLSYDSDEDGFTQIQEFLIGTDPYDANDFPVLLSELTFEDGNLEKCIEAQYVNNNILYANQLTDLYCYDSRISSLQGLELFKNLVSINMDGGNITNVDVLSQLSKLQNITLSRQKISDISSLNGLQKLEYLYLSYNNISDLSSLDDLPMLRTLDLNENDITDLSPLANFPLLNGAYFEGNDGILCTNQRVFYDYASIPLLCLQPDILDNRGYLYEVDFESDKIDSFIQFAGEPWSRTKVGFDSEFSLQSPDIDDSESTSFTITTDTAKGIISFDYYIESESCCDHIRFYIDNQEVQLTETQIQWSSFIYLIEQGTHTFKWEYRKDGSASTGIDGVRIDNILIPIFFAETLSVLPDISGDGMNNMGRLNFNDELTQFVLEIEDHMTSSTYSSIFWSVNYENISMHTMLSEDSASVGLFGVRSDEGFEGRLQFFVRDASSGARVNVYNWPANWQGAKLTMLPDLTGDGIAEVAIQGRFKDGNRPQLVVKDGASANNLRTYQFPDLWNNPEYMAFSDVTGDGVPEIALFGLIKRNGKPQIRIIDGANASNKLKSYTFPNNWDNVSWNRLSDSNDDGEDDWGLFGRRIDDGRSQLIVKDARNPRGALRIYAWTSGFDNAKFYSIPDMNNDGIDEVAAGGYRSDIDRYQLTVKDGLDRNVALANYGWPNSWTNASIHVLGDITGDGLSEIALAGLTLDGEYILAIKHGDTDQGELSRYSIGSDWLAKPQIKVIEDIDSDGLQDIMLIGKNKERENIAVSIGSASLN